MIRLLLLTALVFGSARLGAQSATVEGDVYLLNKAGDVKKAAAGTVALLLSGPSLQKSWLSVCKAYETVWDSASAVHATLPLDQSKRSVDALYERTSMQKIRTIMKTGRTSPTGMNAHFRFSRVKPGKYVLVSWMQLGTQLMTWQLPIVVSPGQQLTVDLDNNTVRKDAPSCGTAFPEK
jgi:hypothetical protein